MIVYHELKFAIFINVKILNRVSLVNLSINNSRVNELASVGTTKSEFVHSEFLVKELRGENN